MIILLTDEYRVISRRQNNFALEHFHKTARYPEGRWVRLGYHPGLRSALIALPDHVAKTEELEDLRALLDRLEDIANKISR